MTTIGIIGVGRMGSAFASRLVAAGFTVVAYDVTPAARDRAERVGCTAAASISSVFDASPAVVITSLPTVQALADVVAEIADGGPRSTVMADTSTLDSDAKSDAHDRLAAVGVRMLDCPVSGTGAQAIDGDLIVYASGDDEAIEAAAEVLEVIGRRVHRVGAFGRGMAIKILANVMVGIHNTAAAEMIALAERAGLDPSEVVELVADGAGQSRMLEVRGPAMASHRYGYGASVDLFRKDLSIMTAFARSVGARTPLLDVVNDQYERAALLGFGNEESAAVHSVYLDEVDGRSDL